MIWIFSGISSKERSFILVIVCTNFIFNGKEIQLKDIADNFAHFSKLYLLVPVKYNLGSKSYTGIC